MRLLLDLGNSRLKAASRAPDGTFRLLGEACHRETGIEAALAAALQGTAVDGWPGAWCANVAGAEIGRAHV